jgi:hypothetical protein
MNRDCLACQAPLQHLLETDPTLAPLWQSLARLRFAAGETVLPMGAAAASVWWVEHGVVRLYFVAADGRERNRSFHAKGTWVSGGIPPEPGVSLRGCEQIRRARAARQMGANQGAKRSRSPPSRPRSRAVAAECHTALPTVLARPRPTGRAAAAAPRGKLFGSDQCGLVADTRAVAGSINHGR